MVCIRVVTNGNSGKLPCPDLEITDTAVRRCLGGAGVALNPKAGLVDEKTSCSNPNAETWEHCKEPSPGFKIKTKT